MPASLNLHLNPDGSYTCISWADLHQIHTAYRLLHLSISKTHWHVWLNCPLVFPLHTAAVQSEILGSILATFHSFILLFHFTTYIFIAGILTTILLSPPQWSPSMKSVLTESSSCPEYVSRYFYPSVKHSNSYLGLGKGHTSDAAYRALCGLAFLFSSFSHSALLSAAATLASFYLLPWAMLAPQASECSALSPQLSCLPWLHS